MFSVFLFTAKTVLAQGKTWSSRCSVNNVATIQGLECLFGNILTVITATAGFIFFGMFIIGGFQYISSQGDAKSLSGANSTLFNSVLGLIGTIGSYLILKLISEITGLPSILDFKIPGGTP